ncbi:MAG: YncE family protein [Deltaproteobacteria bacterium]|nr:YncE family protein [Deltaproteobacteria bacterium]
MKRSSFRSIPYCFYCVFLLAFIASMIVACDSDSSRQQLKVTITGPAYNEKYVEGNAVTFSGTATSKGEPLTGDSLEWASSIDGTLGTGEEFVTDGLSVGHHIITFTATDDRGDWKARSTRVRVRTRYPDEVVKTIYVGALFPAVLPDDSTLYLTNADDENIVTVIGLPRIWIKDVIDVGNTPYGIAVKPNGTRLYVANVYDKTLSVINPISNTVIDTIALGNGPYDVSITYDGRYVCVTNSDDNTVSVISTATNLVAGTIPVGQWPHGLAAMPDERTYVYVANSHDGTVSVLRLATNEVIETVPAGTDPFNIVITPDGSTVYVTNFESDTVTVIDTADNSIITTIPVAAGPYDIAVTPDGNYVYVTNFKADQLTVIDVEDNTIIDEIPLGDGPFGVAVSNDGTQVYVANSFDDTVSFLGFSIR